MKLSASFCSLLGSLSNTPIKMISANSKNRKTCICSDRRSRLKILLLQKIDLLFYQGDFFLWAGIRKAQQMA